MKKSNKIWLTSFASLSAATILPLLAASCGKELPKDKYVYEFSSPFSNTPFEYDASRSFGGFSNVSYSTQTSVGLIRLQSLNEPEVKNKDSKTYITEPTWTKRKLSLASKIILTDKEGKISTFDSDEAEIKEPATHNENGISYYNQPAVALKSNNKQSINSKEFDDKLKSAVKLQFVVRENVHWVDKEGNKTEYTVNARDFWYSWLRTLSINKSFRLENGGSEELEKEVIDSLSEKTSTVFTDQQNYANNYLFALFNVDSSKFSKEESFIQKTSEGKDAVTFEALDTEKEVSFNQFINKIMFADYTFMPAPSQYIDAENQKEKLPVWNYNGKKDEKTEEIEKKLRAIPKDKLVSKVGAYWYGLSLNNVLFVGPYYGAPQKGQEVILRKNTHYYDQEFAKNSNTIKEIVYIYNQNIDADTFNKRSFDKYKQNRLSQISFSSLKENQQQEILKQASKYGLRHAKTLNKTNPFYRMVSQGFIRPIPKDQSSDFYAFNDAYSKLVYGVKKDELAKGLNDPYEFISGRGLVFRTLINAAINWDEFASQATGGQGYAWLAKVADGSAIGGSDQDTASVKTPADVKDKINSLFAIKADKTGKINFGNKLGDSLEPSENEEHIKNTSDKTAKLKSAGFDKVKEELQKLFEQFDKENPDLKGQNFEFEHLFPYINIPAAYKRAFENIEKVFNELNPRLKISVYHTQDSEDAKFQRIRKEGANGSELLAWGYDYDAIGSGYDGLSWNANLIPTLIWIAENKDTDKTKLIKENFPLIYDLAQKIVEYGKTNWVAPIPFEKLHLIENKYKSKLLDQILNYKLKEVKDDNKTYYTLERKEVQLLDEKNQPKIDEKTKKPITKMVPIPWKPADGKHLTDIYTLSAKFWFEYIHKMTNEEAVKLMTEFTSFFHVDFTYNIFKNRNEFGKFLVQKHFIVPDESTLNVSIYSDWRIKEEKK
ncbi:OppA family ABC transporter substrate-binding lipoprotein [Metamycoplasma canadense]|nr:variable surface lipoprotein [Metamycoplasma canadense]